MNKVFIIKYNETEETLTILNSENSESFMNKYNEAAKEGTGKYINMFPYEGSWWCIVMADNPLEAAVIFKELYRMKEEGLNENKVEESN